MGVFFPSIGLKESLGILEKLPQQQRVFKRLSWFFKRHRKIIRKLICLLFLNESINRPRQEIVKNSLRAPDVSRTTEISILTSVD